MPFFFLGSRLSHMDKQNALGVIFFKPNDGEPFCGSLDCSRFHLTVLRRLPKNDHTWIKG